MPIDPEEKAKKEFEKLTLEIQKLERDIKIKPFTDRERFWSETVRLIGIALITGLVTFLVNRKTERSQNR